MTVNKKIQIADYNSIQNKVAQILGEGSATFGYGQLVRSFPVTTSNTVAITEWNNLRFDILNAFVHQNGSNPATLAQATLNAIVKSDGDSTSFSGYINGTTLTVTSVTSGMVAIGQTITASGVSPGTQITALLSNPQISVSGIASVTLVGDYYEVTVNIATQPAALPINQYCEISGSTNINYNGTLLILDSTVSTITLKYDVDPGSYTGGSTTVRMLRQNPWGYSVWTVNNSQTVTIRSMTGNNSTDHPYLQYDTIADTLQTNRFVVAPTQVATVNKGSISKTWPDETNSVWNTTLSCKVTVQFTNATKARQFFNSGGAIRLASSRSGGSATAQNTAWTSLLSSAGTRAFGAQQPGSGLGANDGSNFYNLTNAYQTWYSTSSSSPYTLNFYRISARMLGSAAANNQNGTATGIEFLVEWIDGYQDPGVPEPGDSVDGTITLSATTVEPSGTLVPAGSGNFVNESPVISFDNFVYSPSKGPAAPTGVSAAPGDTQATITFTPPPPSGIYPNLYYTVVSTPGSITRTATASPMIFTGLTNGTSYTFRVSASNAIGTSPLSTASNSVIPARVPNAPTIGTATYGNTSATVTFTPPANNGGSAVIGYTGISTPGSIISTSATSPMSFSGLTNGLSYTFRVAAINSVGTGAFSNSSNAVIPRTVPEAPNPPVAVSGRNASTILTFDEPTNTGGIGIPITSYSAISTPGNITATSTRSPMTVTGLTNGTTYTFQVRAINSEGPGNFSTASNSIVPYTVPAAPTIGTITRGVEQVTISWTPPTNNGGSAITAYNLYCSSVSPAQTFTTIVTAPAVTATISPLVSGRSYFVRVAAINAAGEGAQSAASSTVVVQ